MPLNIRLRNGSHGYGAVTKTLHWLTVALLAAQFAVGYQLDGSGGGRGRGRGRGHGSGQGRGRGGASSDFDDIELLSVHVTLGLLILLVAIARVAWRLTADLPPWDERLTSAQRRIVHRTEQVLLGCLFLIPVTGLVLVLGGEDDLLWLHVSAHVVFFAALTAHLAMVLGKRLLPRML